jgi:hypothetical protein
MKNAVFRDVTRRVALVRTDVSDERSSSIFRIRVDELGITLAVTSSRSSLRRNTMSTSRKTVFVIVTAVKTSNLT